MVSWEEFDGPLSHSDCLIEVAIRVLPFILAMKHSAEIVEDCDSFEDVIRVQFGGLLLMNYAIAKPMM